MSSFKLPSCAHDDNIPVLRHTSCVTEYLYASLFKHHADHLAIVSALARHKASDFKALTKTRSAVHIALVTTYGLKEGKYAGVVQSVVTSDDLFC